jgi:uncharacterized membrane protein YbhN (UPF0104 family)
MLVLLARTIASLVSMVLDAIRWDIGNSALKREVPVTVTALSAALVGALIAGFFGAIVGGVVGSCCAIFYRNRESASYVH